MRLSLLLTVGVLAVPAGTLHDDYYDVEAIVGDEPRSVLSQTRTDRKPSRETDGPGPATPTVLDVLQAGRRPLSEAEAGEYCQLVGRLDNKLAQHANIIVADERGRQLAGLPAVRKDAPLGFTPQDWQLVEMLGPALATASDLLPRLPRDALRTLRRLLEVARLPPSKRLTAPFSKEATGRLHAALVRITEQLMKASADELRPQSLSAAQALVKGALEGEE